MIFRSYLLCVLIVLSTACSSGGGVFEQESSSSDGDSEKSTGGDTESSGEDGVCLFRCVTDCDSVGGTEMPGACPDPGRTCCDLTAVDSDSETTGACDGAATLKEAGTCQGLLLGAAVNPGRIADGGYSGTVERELNYVTAENEMKWERLQPTRGWFTYGDADQVVDFATSRNMKVKGHCLVWHSQLPEWVNGIRDQGDMETVITDHIVNVMGHFKSKVYAWDVVNEAVMTDNDTGVGNPRMRDSVFWQVLGEDYIDLAFHTAKEQDADVKLYYNDYSIDSDNDKVDFVYQLIEGLVNRGVPIDGVGFQMHIGTPNNITTGAEVAANMRRFAELGLEVLISEMDINLCGGREVSWQENLYHDVALACVQEPACSAITFWGVNDGSSWLNGWDRAGCGWGESPRPLLFDDGFNKKETYNRVMEALKGR